MKIKIYTCFPMKRVQMEGGQARCQGVGATAGLGGMYMEI